jgi:hypothetical protein
MPGSGGRTYRIRFERRARDANGDPLGAFTFVFERACEVVWLKGSEPVVAQRLQGLNPAVIRVPATRSSRAIDNAWRCVDARIPKPGVNDYLAIHSKTLSEDRSFVEVLATRGGEA